MYEVNRSVITVIPQQGFWNWLSSLPNINLEDIELEDLQINANSYLIEPCDDLDEVWDVVANTYLNVIFSAELSDWCEDKTQWPDLYIDIFAQWFDIALSTIVNDLVDEEIERELFEPITVL